MALDQRSTAILAYLSQTPSYVTPQELMEKFKISKRTAYYDIEKINGWLEENKLPRIEHIRSAGFHLKKETAEEIPERLNHMPKWHYEYSPKERKAWLALYLTARSEALYLENLMEKVRVSRNTVIEDLKELKKELQNFELELQFERAGGYQIKGKEEDKRKVIVFYLQQLLPKQSWQSLLLQLPILFNEQHEEMDPFIFEKMKAIKEIAIESEKELNIRYTDDFLHSLTLRLLLFGKRLTSGKEIVVDPIEKEVLRKTNEYRAAQGIAGKLSKLFEIAFPEDEVFYITKHLLSSRIQFADSLFENNSRHLMKVLAETVSHMVSDFQRYACIFFENRDEVENGLFLHIKSAYYRVLYGLEVDSHLANSIQEKYPDTFRITKKIIDHLQNITGKKVNDEEIALIAIHFGGWLEKMGKKPVSRKSVLLVCNNGIGTSRLLQHQLEGLFSTVDVVDCVSLRDFENNSYEADFVISTIPLEEKGKPVFVVSPILTEIEKEKLLKKVNAFIGVKPVKAHSVEALLSIIESHADIRDRKNLQMELREYLYQNPTSSRKEEKPNLSSLLKIQHIQTLESVSDWRKAIQIAAAPLVENHFIETDYVEAMIDVLDKTGPYVVVSPLIAIPHARPQDGVNELGMSLLQLKNSISFSEKGTHPVKLLIVLAAVDGDSHLKALGELTKILNDKKLKDQLIAAESAEKIYELIQMHAQ